MVDLWSKWRRSREQRAAVAAGAGERAGKRFAEGYAAQSRGLRCPDLAGCDTVVPTVVELAAHLEDDHRGPVRRPAAAADHPIVSTAHAELYDYDEPDDAEPGLR